MTFSISLFSVLGISSFFTPVLALDCTGPFTIQNQQPVGCLPYPNSLWNKPLPTDVVSHLLPNSDTIVQSIFTNDGKLSYPWTRRQSVASVTADGNDAQSPLYYGQSTDPVYLIQSCVYPDTDSLHNPVGKTIHAPSGATFSGQAGDRHIAIWDQTTNLLFTSYTWGVNPKSGPLPTCPGNGHAGTASDPCPAIFSYCGISNWTTDPTGYDIDGDDSLGSGGFATHMRAAEMIAGKIPHAIYVGVDCAVGSIFPQSGGAEACPAGVTNRPPLGALFFLDYTPAQLADIKSKVPAWQYPILEAMTIYGAYFGDTGTYGNSSPVLWGFEGAGAYRLAGLESPLYKWLKTFPNDPTNGDPSQPLGCYGYGSFQGCDMGQFVNVPFQTGPNCPTNACDISKHLHIANECVAKGLAGLSGGCGTSPSSTPQPSLSPTPSPSPTASVSVAPCQNPTPIPSGFSAPCPVFSVSPQSGSLSQNFTVAFKPPTNGTVWIYKTMYITEGSTWKSVTLPGTIQYQYWLQGQTTYNLQPTTLGLTAGTHYLASWDWTWDAANQCYKGPGSTACGGGSYRLQQITVQ